MRSIAVETLIAVNYRENTDKGNEEKMEEANESFVSMKRNLGIYKK